MEKETWKYYLRNLLSGRLENELSENDICKIIDWVERNKDTIK